MSKLLIGWAEESLVPNQKVNILGQFYERIFAHVEDFAQKVMYQHNIISYGDHQELLEKLCDILGIQTI